MTDMVSTYNILLAGNESHRFGESGILKSKDGFTVFKVSEYDKIEIRAKTDNINLVLIDDDLAWFDILNLAVKLRTIDTEMAIIYLTKDNSTQNDTLWRYGIDDLVRKHSNDIEIKYRIQRAL